jgi:predicted GTPase
MQADVPTNVTINNFPTWTLWVIAGAQIVFGIATLLLAIVAVLIMLQVKQHIPSIMSSVDDSLKNAKTISDDAANTIHSVTGTVTKVSNVVGTVTERMESPVIRAAGALAGVAAGLRSVRGKKQVVVDHDVKVVRRKRGLLR